MERLSYLIFILPTLISLFSVKNIKLDGSDEVYHFLMIDAIKKNRNKFIDTMPFFVGKNRHSYPQLLHWLFSFLQESNIIKFSRYTGTVGHFLSGISLLVFTILIFPIIKQSGFEIPQDTFYIITALTYALSPINYDLFNAKNIGFSARGFGLFLGQIYTYLVVFFILQDDISLIFYLSIILYIVLLSSVFTVQYIILFSLTSSLLFQNILLLLPIIIGASFFIIIHGKVAITFFRGQFAHKKIYALYLAKIFILKLRPSIWRDLIYDFWIKLYKIKKREETFFSVIQYITTNPVVNLLIGIPYLLLFYTWFNTINSNNPILNIFTLIILCVFILFVITSFSWTRFLGEPERYVEFALGIIGMYASIILYPNYFFLYVILILSFTIIILRILLVKKKLALEMNSHVNLAKTSSGSVAKAKYLNSFKIQLEQIALANKELKVLCNFSESTKTLFSSNYQSFRHPLFQEYIGKFHFTDIYNDSYFMIKLDVIKEIVKEFSIDILVYGKNIDEEKKFQEFLKGFNLEIIDENEVFAMIKFTHK